MFTRYHVWQEPAISSTSETDWTNIIVTKYPAIDIRFLLKGYGWKPNPTDENLSILYEGRYDIYYRELGTPPWIKFATVISERASSNVAYVYEDASVALGLSAEKIYELKIVALDGEKFTNWGGVIEGISAGGVFYTDIRMRMKRPIEINIYNNILANEYVILGKEIINLSVSDSVFGYSFTPEMFTITFMDTAFDTLSIEETPRLQVNLALGWDESVYDAVTVVNEYVAFTFDFYRLWWLNEEISVVEFVDVGDPEPKPAPARWDDINVEEYLVVGQSEFELFIFDEISIYDEGGSQDPVLFVTTPFDLVSIAEEISRMDFVPPYKIRIMEDGWSIPEPLIVIDDGPPFDIAGWVWEQDLYLSGASTSGWVDESLGPPDDDFSSVGGVFKLVTGYSAGLQRAIGRYTGTLDYTRAFYLEFEMKYNYTGIGSPYDMRLAVFVGGDGTPGGNSKQAVVEGMTEQVNDANPGGFQSAKNRWVKVQVIHYGDYFYYGNSTNYSYNIIRKEDAPFLISKDYFRNQYNPYVYPGNITLYVNTKGSDVEVRKIRIGSIYNNQKFIALQSSVGIIEDVTIGVV